jgi:stress-induced morphogen
MELRSDFMPMKAEDIINLIQDAMPDAHIELTDLRGDGDHYAAKIESAAFAGKTRIQQHQMVYDALEGRVGGVLHALSLTTIPVPGRRGIT